jgi:hypothetical protein
MRIKTAFGTSVLVAAFVAVYGCSKDDAPSARISQKGEACQVTNDCAGGLACIPVPSGNVSICTVATFAITQTARECAVIQCTTPADCTPTPPSSCPNLLNTCAADAGSASVTACEQYDALCKPDTTKIDCVQNKCINKCTTDLECVSTSAGKKCAGGQCVQCAGDSDCSSGQQCLTGSCQSPCQGDGDCAGFQRCNAGKCTESGCQTDRECVAATRNVEATCGTDGKCIVPCQTDNECGNPKDYTFFSCIKNQCLYTGCQSDKDCRLLLTGPSDSGTLPPKEHVVCRDKTTPNPLTTPAQ